MESIRQFKSRAHRLMSSVDPVLDPDVLLAAVRAPYQLRVIAVTRANDLVGILYARERTILGIPTGILHIGTFLPNAGLENLLVAEGADSNQIFMSAMRRLLQLPRVISVTIRVPEHSAELNAVQKLVSSARWDLRRFSASSHAYLPFPETYEAFLSSLHRSTRLNFRRYRRRLESVGYTFVEKIPMQVFHSAVWALKDKCKMPSRVAMLQERLNLMLATDRPLAVGLRHVNGDWLSIAGGCYRPDQAVMLLQLNNDREFEHESLSVVLRSHIIEMLIRERFRSLVFWGGTGPPLSRYSRAAPTCLVQLDKRTYPWRAFRRLLWTVGPFLPSGLISSGRRLMPEAFASADEQGLHLTRCFADDLPVSEG